MSQSGRAFSHGFEIYLEKATLLYEFATLGGQPATSMPLTLLTETGEVQRVDLGETGPIDAFTDEIQFAVDAIESGSEPTALSGRSVQEMHLRFVIRKPNRSNRKDCFSSVRAREKKSRIAGKPGFSKNRSV